MWGDGIADSGSRASTSQLENDIVTYVLNDLKPYTNYEVFVSSGTSAGNGTVVNIDGLETDEDG